MQKVISGLTSPRDLDRFRIELDRIGAQLDDGYTLPADWYYDPAIYELEREAIFGRTWHLVGLTSDFGEPGSYKTVDVDEHRSFIISRDAAGQLHAFYNVCPHRGATLCDAPGTGKTIQCGYHGWTWRLDGRLHRAPLMDEGEGFDATDFRLREVSLGVWEPFIFLNPDPDADPLAEYLGELPTQVAALGVDMTRIVRDSYHRVWDQVYECNWKVAVENGLECYHCSVAHPGFADTVDLNRWQISMAGNCVTQGTRLRQSTALAPKANKPTRLGELATDLALSESGTDLALFHYVFPNQSIQVWPGPSGSFSIGRFIPLGVERTRRVYMRFWTMDVPREVSDESWRFTMQVASEDLKLCEGVQRGLRSGGYARGRFQLVSPGLGEHGTRQMNKLTVERLRSFVS